MSEPRAQAPHDAPPTGPPAGVIPTVEGSPAPPTVTRLPLSVLVDQVAAGLAPPPTPEARARPGAGADASGPPELRRDQHFVRALSATLDARRPYLRLEVVEALGLEDVVATFHMRETVRLVVTGYPPAPHPGAVTLTIDEADFPHTTVLLSPTPAQAPYEFCTLDYALAGRSVTVRRGPLAGRRGTILASATVGDRQDNRVRLDDGRVVSLPGDALDLTET